jgi:hypothetical protein
MQLEDYGILSEIRLETTRNSATIAVTLRYSNKAPYKYKASAFPT